MGDSLARATDFTHFHPAAIEARDPAFIGAYTQLESWHCTLRCSERVDADRLIAAVSHCTRITDLTLCHRSMTNDQLESLLSHLPLLSSLQLDHAFGLTSLSFASRVAHLGSTLTRLRFNGRRIIPPADVVHLHSLRVLTSLRLGDTFSGDLSPSTLAGMLTRDSRDSRIRSDIWPHLTLFESHLWYVFDNTQITFRIRWRPTLEVIYVRTRR